MYKKQILLKKEIHWSELSSLDMDRNSFEIIEAEYPLDPLAVVQEESHEFNQPQQFEGGVGEAESLDIFEEPGVWRFMNKNQYQFSLIMKLRAEVHQYMKDKPSSIYIYH